ncbi:hypothetical protein CB0940_09142 [Cercospora beticola]|uniref:Uncharacterized protein n=1 Tax=Cercospora beticola TaxID=122368 RepID=A0A2G5HIJ7_CERBT|nr:hypothetical protein CB0940_09142 [Cercospora beticola]PIA92335.1 hypothetical protein CB0940_09142 [Cercospora beticola]WPB06569.1 hypothetical protein RHO25_011226 [Cercospora beticola]CAK1366483.1 unnamed protein product [Cercospora beticola]
MSTLNFTCTQGSPSPPIVLNNTSGRICGLASPSNNSRLASCCNNNPVQQYLCTEYCSTNLVSQQFVDCLVEDSDVNTVLASQPFCQEGIMGNITERLSNGDSSSSSPKRISPISLRVLFLVAIFSMIFTVNGTIVPSLSPGNLVKRQGTSTGCTINVMNNFTTTSDSSKAVSPRTSCGTDTLCTFGFPIDTGILDNNRTINGSSAAEPEFDQFFLDLQNLTSRFFPALSSAELNYDVIVRGGASFNVAFTPRRWCANLMTDCEGIGGEGDGMKAVEACGPTFVSDYAENAGDMNLEDMVIQGILSTVITD